MSGTGGTCRGNQSPSVSDAQKMLALQKKTLGEDTVYREVEVVEAEVVLLTAELAALSLRPVQC